MQPIDLKKMRAMCVPISAMTLCVVLAHSPRFTSAQTSTAYQPDLPQITVAQGDSLVGLARTTMLNYLKTRGGPSTVQMPKQLKSITGRDNAVAVTLRSEGAIMAAEVHDSGKLCTNLIVAALQAMRSPRLPDRVDPNVLADLTVEVEVLGKPTPFDPNQVDQAVLPGLCGIQVGKGASAVHVLPSAAYVLGLTPRQLLRGAMIRFRQQRLHDAVSTSRPTPPQPAAFATRHFVGYPGKPAIELYRGKLVPEPANLDAKAALDAAERVARYLVSRQDVEGFYDLGEWSSSQADQLYATWSLARLAQQRQANWLTQAVQRAVEGAKAKLVRTQGQATVKAENPEDQLAATALLAIILEMDASEQAQALRRQLLAGITAGLDTMSAPATGGPKTAASQPASMTKGKCLAAMALTNDPACTPFLASLKRELASARPATAEQALWAFRAGLSPAWPPAFGNPTDPPNLVQYATTGPPEDRGGFAVGSSNPNTYLTGLASVCLARILTAPTKLSPATATALGRQLAAGKAFCANMIYLPEEAYFTADPNSKSGAVRAASGYAAVTTRACAAAIEALTTH